MIPKYTIEYREPFRKQGRIRHYSTDDPVACEEFLAELLEHDCRILSIEHEGVKLSQREADKFIKTAAGMLAARHICASLAIDADEEKYRFGMAA